jgi:hypothetical protein
MAGPIIWLEFFKSGLPPDVVTLISKKQLFNWMLSKGIGQINFREDECSYFLRVELVPSAYTTYGHYSQLFLDFNGWNNITFRVRVENPDSKYGYKVDKLFGYSVTKQGFLDTSARLSDGKSYEITFNNSVLKLDTEE